MKYTFDGNELSIVPNTTEICDTVPCGTYTFTYNKFTGLHVVTSNDIPKVNFPLYGKLAARVDKSFRAYERRRPKNTGVLLSGEPGMGKSLFIRLAAERAMEMGMPVFIVDRDLPGVVNFISELNCRALVILDEYEKNFRQTEQDHDDDDGINSTQEQFLSVMDGICGDSAKMFIAAVNDTNKLSKFMLNRPGRFLYHFEFGCLSNDEIVEVCDSCLSDKSLTPTLLMRLTGHKVNYDALFAIIDELNEGETVDSTLDDLNLLRKGSDVRMKCTLHTEKGDLVETTMFWGLGERGKDHEVAFNAWGGLGEHDVRSIRVHFDDESIRMLPDGKLIVESKLLRTRPYNANYDLVEFDESTLGDMVLENASADASFRSYQLLAI